MHCAWKPSPRPLAAQAVLLLSFKISMQGEERKVHITEELWRHSKDPYPQKMLREKKLLMSAVATAN
jgi:hypothetical protein